MPPFKILVARARDVSVAVRQSDDSEGQHRYNSDTTAPVMLLRCGVRRVDFVPRPASFRLFERS